MSKHKTNVVSIGQETLRDLTLAALKGYQQQLVEIQAKIVELQGRIGELNGDKPTVSVREYLNEQKTKAATAAKTKTVKPTGPARRQLSQEGRDKIAAAQKKRWASVRKAKKLAIVKPGADAADNSGKKTAKKKAKKTSEPSPKVYDFGMVHVANSQVS